MSTSVFAKADILRMADFTGISPVEIVSALGLEDPELSERVRNTSTLEGLWALTKIIPRGSTAEIELLNKALNLSMNLDDTLKVHTLAPEGSKVRVDAMCLIECQARQALNVAINFESTLAVDNKLLSFPATSDVRLETLKRALDHVSNLDQAQEIHTRTNRHGEMSAETLRRLERFALSALGRASTLEEVWAIYEKVPENASVGVIDNILERALALSSSHPEVTRVVRNSRRGGRARRESLRKMAAFFQNHEEAD